MTSNKNFNSLCLAAVCTLVMLVAASWYYKSQQNRKPKNTQKHNNSSSNNTNNANKPQVVQQPIKQPTKEKTKANTVQKNTSSNNSSVSNENSNSNINVNVTKEVTPVIFNQMVQKLIATHNKSDKNSNNNNDNEKEEDIQQSISEVFTISCAIINNLPKQLNKKFTSEMKLQLYGLYKQAMNGSMNTAEQNNAPSQLNIIQYSKWQAWFQHLTMPISEAKYLYACYVNERILVPNAGNKAVVNFKIKVELTQTQFKNKQTPTLNNSNENTTNISTKNAKKEESNVKVEEAEVEEEKKYNKNSNKNKDVNDGEADADIFYTKPETQQQQQQKSSSFSMNFGQPLSKMANVEENLTTADFKDDIFNQFDLYEEEFNTEAEFNLVRDYIKLHQVQINEQNESGTTFFAIAVDRQKHQLAELLLTEFGADCNIADDEGYSPLHCAAMNDDIIGVQLLLKYGANKDAVSADAELPKDMTDSDAINQLLT